MRIRGVLAGLVTLLMVLTAFAMLPAVPAKAQATGNTLYIAMQQDMPDFNTWNLGSNSVWKANVIGFGFEGLVGLDYDLKPFPLLAESYTFDLPTLTYTFHLRHGVMFNDNVSGEMTADDVVFMYKAAREDTTLSSNIINAFDADDSGTVEQAEIDAGVIKVDTYTVRMKLPKPYGQFLTTTAGLYILPKKIWINHLDTTEGPDVDHGALLDTKWGDSVQATVATGPFKYGGGIPSTYRVMDKWTGYWGKQFATPNGYSLYPPNVDHLYFKIYASLDTAILALQSAQVDYIDWAVTAGRIPGLQADPNIGLSFQPENGYRYLAFNQKLEPMNNLSFRQAVSHLINKDQIVNVYLGGYGAKGSASEPPFWGPNWHNNTVPTYPFNIVQARSILNNSGFLDRNGDGLRELPNGLPMDKITILTPPADYDPIRIRAGELIALNMRSVGLNAEAKAIDFNTLVAKLQSMDFQMLIIGWSLASEPVGNVFDILGPKATQNTFGFWSLDDPNPFYSSLGGVVTRADTQTQIYANEVTRLAKLARENFTVEGQQLWTMQAEGVIAKAIPVNVLYYSTNVEAYRQAWTGWLPWLGSLLQSGVNLYCLSKLKLAGAAAAIGATATVNAGLNLPGEVEVGGTVSGTAVAIDNTGAPAAGAAVSVGIQGYAGQAASVSVSTAQKTGTTGSDGTYKFNVTGLSTGYSYVNVTITKGGVSSAASAIIRGVTQYPMVLALTMTPERLVLRPAEKTLVEFTVTDELGATVEGARIQVDPNLISYGRVDKLSVVTDADGYASMNYSAPSQDAFDNFSLNTHLAVTLSCNATKAGYTFPGLASVFPLIYNEAPSSWSLVKIVDLTAPPALNDSVNSTIIRVQALNETGVELPFHKLNVTYTNNANATVLVDPTMSVTTDDLGLANIQVTVKADTPSTAFKVQVQNLTIINSGPATVTVTYRNETTAPENMTYAGYVQWNTTAQFMGPMGKITAEAHVWNNTGELTNNVLAGLVVGTSKAGDLANSVLAKYSTNSEGWGMTVVSNADAGNYITGGPFNTTFNETDWDFWYNVAEYIGWDWGTIQGVNIVNGSLDVPISGIEVAASDYLSQLYIVPNGLGIFNGTTYSYEIDGTTSLKGDYVIQKSSKVVATSMSMRNPADPSALKPVIQTMATGVDSTRVYGVGTDENNEPVAGATLQCFQVFRSYARSTDFVIVPWGRNPFRTGSVTTDATGTGYMTLLSLANNMITLQPSGATIWQGFIVPGTNSPLVNAKASVRGAVSIFATQSVVMIAQQAFIELTPIVEAAPVGADVLVTATAKDINGAAIPNLAITLTVSGGASVASPTQGTDPAGKAVFAVSTKEMRGVKAAFVTTTASGGGPGYAVAAAQMMFPVKNPGPVISVGAPLGTKVSGDNVTLEGSATSPLGFTSIKVKLDSESTVTLSDETSATTVSLSHSFGELKSGEHTLVINATDALGVSTEKTVTFTVAKGKTDMLAWSLAAIGWILFAIVAVLLFMRTRKPKSEAMAPEAGEAKEAPPPEQKL